MHIKLNEFNVLDRVFAVNSTIYLLSPLGRIIVWTCPRISLIVINKSDFGVHNLSKKIRRHKQARDLTTITLEL